MTVVGGPSAADCAAPAGGHARFRDLVFGSAELNTASERFLRQFGRGPDLRRTVWPLASNPLGAYARMADLAPDGDETFLSALRTGIRAAALSRVDSQIQALYRRHLAGCSIPENMTHARRLALLDAVEDEAHAIVETYEWDWLADWLGGGTSVGTLLRQLSNFAFDCGRINLRMTYHCNIQCAHCYNSSGPHRKHERLDLAVMTSIIAQMPSVGIGSLNITGGEPFLYPDRVETLIAAAREAGINAVSIYTNAFFAASDAKADEVLSRIAGAGFGAGMRDHIKASTGTFHGKFVGLDRVATLARRYHRRFGRPLGVDYERGPGESLADARRRAAMLAPAELGAPVAIRFRTVGAVGRAAELDIPAQDFSDICLGINQLAIDPDGRARPCCGLNDKNDGIVVGRAGELSLRALIKSMQNDPIAQFIRSDGLEELSAVVGKPLRPGGYGGICDLCQDVVGGIGDREPLARMLFPRQKFYPFWFDLAGPKSMVR